MPRHHLVMHALTIKCEPHFLDALAASHYSDSCIAARLGGKLKDVHGFSGYHHTRALPPRACGGLRPRASLRRLQVTINFGAAVQTRIPHGVLQKKTPNQYFETRMYMYYRFPHVF